MHTRTRLEQKIYSQPVEQQSHQQHPLRDAKKPFPGYIS